MLNTDWIVNIVAVQPGLGLDNLSQRMVLLKICIYTDIDEYDDKPCPCHLLQW